MKALFLPTTLGLSRGLAIAIDGLPLLLGWGGVLGLPPVLAPALLRRPTRPPEVAAWQP